MSRSDEIPLSSTPFLQVGESAVASLPRLEEKTQDPLGNTSLHLAALNGNVEVLSLLLKAGAELEAVNKQKELALHLAARAGKADAVEFLVSDDTVDFVSATGKTSLHEAAESGSLEIFQSLVIFGAKYLTVKGSTDTPLILAVRKGHLSIVEFILKEKRELSQEEIQRAFLAACAGGHEAVVLRFLENEIDVNGDLEEAIERIGTKIFHKVCEISPAHIVKLLIPQVNDINLRDSKKNTPLLFTLRPMGYSKKPLAVVKVLIAAGADPNAIDESRNTILHHVAQWHYSEMVSYLVPLCEPRTLNSLNIENKTPLFSALKYFKGKEITHQTIKTLLDAKADPNLSQCEIPLHKASYNGSILAVNYLLDAKANPNAITESGVTAFHQACEGRQVTVMKRLLELKCNPHAKTTDGQTPLHRSLQISEDPGAAVYFLLEIERVAEDLKAVDRDGNIPLHILAQHYAVRLTDENSTQKNYFIPIAKKMLEIGGIEILFMDNFSYHVLGKGLTPLALAAQRRNEDLFLVLFAEEFRKKYTPLQLQKAYYQACNSGLEGNVVKHFMDLYPADYKFSDGKTPYSFCLTKNEIMELIAQEDKINPFGETTIPSYFVPEPFKSKGKATPLEMAVYNIQDEVIKIFLNKLPNGHLTEEECLHFLVLAIQANLMVSPNKILATVKLLLFNTFFPWEESLGKVNIFLKRYAKELFFPMMRMISHRARIDFFLSTFEYLVDLCGGAITSLNNNGYFLIHTAAKNRHIGIVALLINKYGCKVDERVLDEAGEFGGATPLILAAIGNALPVVELLLTMKAEVNAATRLNRSALFYAAGMGNLQAVKKLVDVKANVVTDEKGNNLLHTICGKNPSRTYIDKPFDWKDESPEIIKFLIESKINPDERNKDGDTPLHCAAETGQLTLVKALNENGVDLCPLDAKGMSPIRRAKVAGRKEIVEYLVLEFKKREAKIYQTNAQNQVLKKELKIPSPACGRG